MKKISKLIILSVILVVLILIYVIISSLIARNKEDDDQYGDSEAFDTSYTAASIDINTLYALRYEIDGASYSFSLNSDHTAWVWDSNDALPLDSIYFANIATALECVTTNIKFNVTSSELSEYGLDSPCLTVTVSDSVHGTQTFCFGDINSYNGQYYFRSLADADSVYMVSPMIPSCFSFTPYEMVLNDELPEIEAENLNRITITTASGVTEYCFYPGGRDDEASTDDFWYVSVDGLDEVEADSDLAEYICGICSLSFSDPVGYTRGERLEFGIDGSVKLEVKYTELRSVTDSNTGTSSDIPFEQSYELVLGYINSDGKIYASLPESVLSYMVDGTVLSMLYSAVEK